MRSAHEDLQQENESLRAQQISSAQEGFEPPCLKCLECDNVVSIAECSTAATVAISSTADVVTNPSSEDTDMSILHHAFISIFIALWAVITEYVTILMPILSYFTRFT